MLLAALSALGGGVVRIFPEILKYFDRKHERSHELAMSELQLRSLQMTGELKVQEKELDLDAEWMKALAVVGAEQGQTARAAGKVVAGISALVRPLVTYWLVALYSLCKISSLVYFYQSGLSALELLAGAWGPSDEALLGSILGFWFVGRVWERKQR